MAVGNNNSASNYLLRTASLPSKRPLSIRAWARVSTHSGWQAFAALNSSGEELLYCGLVENADTFVAYCGSDYAEAGGQLNAEEWTCIHYVLDGTNLHIYKNGVEFYDASISQAGDAAASLSLLISAPGVYNNRFNGAVAAVAVWERALSDAEVAADVAYATPQATDDLWAWWLLDDRTDLNDRSGNGRHLSEVGTCVDVAGPDLELAPPATESNPQASGRGAALAVCAKGQSAALSATGRGQALGACARSSSGAIAGSGTGASVAGFARAVVGAVVGSGGGRSQVLAGSQRSLSPSAAGRGAGAFLFLTDAGSVPMSPIAGGRGFARCQMRKDIAGAHEPATAALLAAFRSQPAAAAAGIPLALWSSAIAPRVYDDLRGYIGGRHRGRLPFVELAQASESYRQRASDLGNHDRRWDVRIHVGGLDETAAESRARTILAAALSVLRAAGYSWLGNSAGGRFGKDPLGYVLEATVDLRSTYSPANFNAGVTNG